VDGAVRDVIDIKRVNFPVFVRNTTTASGSKNGPGATNIPLSCGGMHVNPGDIIVGDVDGVVLIPKDREEEVLTGAKQKVANDEEREAKILGNKEAVIEYVNGMIAKSKKYINNRNESIIAFHFGFSSFHHAVYLMLKTTNKKTQLKY